MSMRIGVGIGISSTGVRKIDLKDAHGRVVGSITFGKRNDKKKKRLQYNFKEISSRILRTTTSGSARQVLTSAKQKVAQLRRQAKWGLCDDKELESAIRHAEAIARVAKKRMRHLQEEENAAKRGGICEAEMEERAEERARQRDGAGRVRQQDDAGRAQEAERALRKLQKLMDEYQEMMREAMEEMDFSDDLEEISEELMLREDLDPEDLELMKRKHRASEIQDIVEADMKYLKAMFDRLERERQQAAAGNVGSDGGGSDSGVESGVALQLGGVDIPVQPTAVAVAPVVEGGAVDAAI